MDINKLKEIAIKEVFNPSFELTKQYLQVHELCLHNDISRIDDIEIDENKNSAAVYFAVEKENYYFVVYVRDMEVNWMGMSAGNRVYLLVCSEVISTEELIDYLCFTPTRSWKKGEKVGLRGERKNNGLIYQPVEKRSGEVEDKLADLLERLLPFKNEIKRLSDLASLEIQIEYYGYKDEMRGIHFKQETIERLSEIGLELDLDLYAGGKDLE